MKNNYSKHVKRQLRELVSIAYERELEEHLERLFKKFTEWKTGKICAGELSILIHQYDRGPSRKMYSYYNSGLDPGIIVAHALSIERLSYDEISEEVLEAIGRMIAFYEDMQNEENEIGED